MWHHVAHGLPTKELHRLCPLCSSDKARVVHCRSKGGARSGRGETTSHSSALGMYLDTPSRRSYSFLIEKNVIEYRSLYGWELISVMR